MRPEQDNETLKDILWCLSNIVAGTENQQMAVLNEEETLNKVIDLLQFDVWLVRREAIFIISNLIQTADSNHELIFHLTSSQDFKVLQSLTKCLEQSEKDNEVCEELLLTFDRILMLDKCF